MLQLCCRADNLSRLELALLTMMPFFCALLMVTKVSNGFFFLCASGYVMLRLQLFRKKHFVVAAFFAAFISLVLCKMLAATAAPISFFAFFKNFVPAKLLAIFWIFYFSLFCIYLMLDAWRMRLNNLPSFLRAFKNKQTLSSEILLLTALIGLLFGCAIDVGCNSAYFFQAQYWLAVVLLLATSDDFERFMAKIRAKSKLAFAVALLAMISFPFYNSYRDGRNLVENNIDIKKRVVRIAQEHDSAKDERKSPRSFQEALSNLKMYQFLCLLDTLNDQPIEIKKKTLIFIAQNDSLLWSLKPAIKGSFLVPALTGMAMIDGVRMKEGSPYDDFDGMPSYQARQIPQTKKDCQPDVVCRLAKSKGFSDVIFITPAENKSGHTWYRHSQ